MQWVCSVQQTQGTIWEEMKGNNPSNEYNRGLKGHMVLFIMEFTQLSWNDIATLVFKKISVLSFKDHQTSQLRSASKTTLALILV